MKSFRIFTTTVVLFIAFTGIPTNASTVVTVDRPLESFCLQTGPYVPAGVTGLTISDPPRYFSNGPGCGADEFDLVPDLAFWKVGSDRIELSWTGPTPGKTVIFLTAARAAMNQRFDFETIYAPEDDFTTFGDNVVVGPDGAILGANGMAIEIDGTNGHAAVDFDQGSGSGSSSGGQAVVIIDPPVDPITELDSPSGPVTILAFDWDGSDFAQIESELTSAGPRIRLKVSGASMPGDWFELTYGQPTNITVDTTGFNTVLVVDGEVVTILQSASMIGRFFNEFRVGAITGTSSVAHRIRVDDVAIGNHGTVELWNLGSQTDFSDRVSSDALWTHTGTAAGPVTTTNGSMKVEITNPSAWSSHRRDSAPSAATRYSVGFDVDTTLLTMAAGDEQLMLVGYPGEVIANNHLQIRLRPNGNDFKVRADAWDDGGTLKGGPWHTTTRGVHRVEVSWRAASDVGVADGYVRLFVDGVLVSSATGLDNDTKVIESIRIGAFAVDAGTSGSITYDEYASWTE